VNFKERPRHAKRLHHFIIERAFKGKRVHQGPSDEPSETLLDLGAHRSEKSHTTHQGHLLKKVTA
jgi:hypothetical protein